MKFPTKALLFPVLALIFTVSPVYGQNLSAGIAQRLPVVGDAIPDASLVCSLKEGFALCNTAYAPTIFGVITDNPAAYMEDSSITDGRLIVSNGVVKLRVSAINGPITKGDMITSSSVPGVGQLADENGYVIGTAMEDLNIPDGQTEAAITTAINVHPEAGLSNAKSNLLAVLRSSAVSPILEPLNTLRYFLAAMLVLVSFSMGFVYFGRSASAGVEAVGRNPLAKKQIQWSVMMHLVITLVIILAGLFTSYLILVL